MTWKDLKRFISDKNYHNEEKEEEEEIKLQSERFRIFRDLPFWISNIEEHIKADIANNGRCCFNHIIGLPKKDGICKPIFDYEMQLAVRNSDYSGCRFHIVTGPRINLAEELIERIHSLFMNSILGIDCKSGSWFLTTHCYIPWGTTMTDNNTTNNSTPEFYKGQTKCICLATLC